MITYFTSESVAAGHPDKICDQVSDAIVDAAITAYPKSRVAIETLVTKNRIVLAGEVTCPKKLPYEQIVRKTIKRLGYTNKLYGFTYQSPISLYIHEQSPDISVGVDDGGAGDQGMMFGYATDETKEYMPLPIMIAHKLVEGLDMARESKTIPYLRPDGKAEVKCAYENGVPKSVEAIIIAVPHDPTIPACNVQKAIITHVIEPICELYHQKIPKIIILNGTGKWDIGGPASDTGVTGRKIIVDTYGSFARHGGGCFSGKDPTKVDRSAAYACRYIAKHIVEAKLAKRAEVRVAYVIGKQQPLDREIECFGTEKKSLSTVANFAWRQLDLSMTGILEGLRLRRPIYEQTAAYGHFGRNGFPWEKSIK
jgi:S-adenosylmethionine synthetase